MVGIDFGTSQCLVAVVEGGEARFLNGPDGVPLTPSAVALDGRGGYLVGRAALARGRLHPEESLQGIKRRLAGPTGEATGLDAFTAAVQLLLALRTSAEGQAVATEECVLAVPAHFRDDQRREVRRAAEAAGWKVRRLISEPVAAALPLALVRSERKNVLVYDFGGGTFDVSVLEVEGGVWQVLATGGDDRLGGVDIDQILAAFAADAFKAQHGTDPRLDPASAFALTEAAERVKIALSDLEAVPFRLPFLSADAAGPHHLDLVLPRATLEALAAPLVDRTLATVQRTLEEAYLVPDQVDLVVLAGGSSEMPLVAREVRRLFPTSQVVVERPLYRIAEGAALLASVLQGHLEERVLVDVAPFSLGIEIDEGLFTSVIPKNTPIPAREDRLFTTITDHQDEVEVHILQGESRLAAENASLGRFALEGIRAAPAGHARIQVSFALDADGLLEVTARDLDTGRAQNVVVKPGAQRNRP